MKSSIVSLLFVSALLLVAQAQPRPEVVCTGGGNTLGATEGGFCDLASNAPQGFRVSIHTIGYLPEDTATYTSQFYFKMGSSVGFETISWPWILHYTESVGLTGGSFHEFEPIPVVIGEQPLGYVMAVDLTDDILVRSDNSPVSDGVLTVTPGKFVGTLPIFAASSQFVDTASLTACFTYTLDQFGAFSVQAGHPLLHGFDGSQQQLPPLAPGVYALISHRALSVSGRMCRARGSTTLCEAGVVLADGHRFIVDAESRDGTPVLEVYMPSGASERLVMDESRASSVRALELAIDGGAEATQLGLRSQVFASSFVSNEEALQDPAIANALGLGDLAHLDLAFARLRARVTFATWANTFTVVVVEEAGQASLLLLSHRHVWASSTEADLTQTVASVADAHGLLGVTVSPGHKEVPLEAFVMEHDSVLATTFTHSVFKQ